MITTQEQFEQAAFEFYIQDLPVADQAQALVGRLRSQLDNQANDSMNNWLQEEQERQHMEAIDELFTTV